ncbi:hypothetical protein Tcan_01906 [Toxocara canis]|uniref:Uncharacterized protein n=1 Tax=Toxocara canis TaxID=6265 RepID=A0A0B2VJS8_TOXCA|nr:hypothetical protein Tcan_01906 [Toxocara canis]
MQHNNACEAVILESSDENLYSIGLSHAQPWASLNAMNDLIDRINTKLLNKKLLSATMYNDGSDMFEMKHIFMSMHVRSCSSDNSFTAMTGRR